MYQIETFRSTLEKIIRILRDFQIKFHLTGGVTSIAYSEPRMTQDVDIVVDNAAIAGKLDLFIKSLEDAAFLFDEQALRKAVEKKQMFQLLDSVEALKLDLYPRELVPGELDRSNSMELFDGLSTPIASLPDVAVAKLIWISKGSHKSRRDVRQLIRIATISQRQAIDHLAESFDLSGLLAEVLAESDEIDA
ncbi:MAG TPA: nucleotidyl transferase AbiEii/AbiGii toxin family protein [Acidobacteriota bacterium]|nr:nucleotidyl transferase AbiEii/AbiGii toxin family protein [Acidobacteriota bacterium]